jgi:diguanylate cyclase (GGDEF)-like protein
VQEPRLKISDAEIVDFAAIEARLHRLERRDWSLWATAVVVLLLLSVAVFVLSAVWSPAEVNDQANITVAVHGLLGMVLLFSLFAVYQQYLIKRLRKQLHDQLALMLGLRSEADVLHRLAALDPLTEVYNHRIGMNRLTAEVAIARQTKRPLTLLVLDLDRFKEINDTYGHHAGDEALKEFARRLQKAVRNSDSVIRHGGDEFVVVLPDCTRDQAMLAVVRLADVTVGVRGHVVPVTFSYGIAEYEPPEGPEQFFNRADHALYAMKREIADMRI